MISKRKKFAEARKSLKEFQDELRQIKDGQNKTSLSKSVKIQETWQPSPKEEIILDK